MAYQKTEKVLSAMEARKNLFLATTADIISKKGLAAVSVSTIAKDSGQSVGLIYNYFADLTELIAAVVQQQLDRDLAAIRASATGTPGAPLAAALSAFYGRLTRPKLAQMLMAQPIYQIGIRNEVAKLIDTTLIGSTPKARTQAAAASLGALVALAASEGTQKTAPQAAVLFVLRGIGYSDAGARRAVERV